MSTADHSPALPERTPADPTLMSEYEERVLHDCVRLADPVMITIEEQSAALRALDKAFALVASQRETITTLTRERDEAWLGSGNLTDRAQDWGDALREALGERYPTMEQTVGAAIAAIHQRNGARAALSRAEADGDKPLARLKQMVEHLVSENARLQSLVDSQKGARP